MKYRDIIIILAAFTTFATTVYGISLVTVPYSFTAGSKAESSKVNANFTELETGVNAAIGGLNTAAGTKLTLAERLAVNMNEDGTFRNFSGMTIGSQWINPAITQNYSTATKFSVDGNYTDTYISYRRLKIFLSGSTVYSEVSTSAYSGGKTLVTLADAVLTSPLVSVEHSLISPTGTADSSMSAKAATGFPLATAATADTIVKRNAYGNFSAATVTAGQFIGAVYGNLSGTANYAKAITIGGSSNVPITDSRTGQRMIYGIASASGDGYTVGACTPFTGTKVTFTTPFAASPTVLLGSTSGITSITTISKDYVCITYGSDCYFLAIGK